MQRDKSNGFAPAKQRVLSRPGTGVGKAQFMGEAMISARRPKDQTTTIQLRPDDLDLLYTQVIDPGLQAVEFLSRVGASVDSDVRHTRRA